MNIPPTVARGIIGLAVVLIALFLVDYRVRQDENPAADKPETDSQRWRRQQQQGEAAFAKSITNDVVGYSRTIETYRDISNDDVGKWWGHATVEYLNPMGGIQRTNLYWKFSTAGRMIFAQPLTVDQWLARKK